MRKSTQRKWRDRKRVFMRFSAAEYVAWARAEEQKLRLWDAILTCFTPDELRELRNQIKDS